MKNTEKLYMKLGQLSNVNSNRIFRDSYHRKYAKNEFEDCLDLLLEYKNKKASDFYSKKGLDLHKQNKKYLESKLLYEEDNSLFVMDNTLLYILEFKLLSNEKEIQKHITVLENRLLEIGEGAGFYSIELNQLKNLSFEEIKKAVEFLSKNQALKLFQPVKDNNGVIEVEINRIKDYLNNLQYYKFN